MEFSVSCITFLGLPRCFFVSGSGEEGNGFGVSCTNFVTGRTSGECCTDCGMSGASGRISRSEGFPDLLTGLGIRKDDGAELLGLSFACEFRM